MKKPLSALKPSSPLFPLALLTLAWLIELTDLILLRGSLDQLGIRPRQWAGLPGILLAPFLHGGLPHLLSNTLPFLLLATLIQNAERKHFASLTLALLLTGGLGTWLIGGRNEIHIGASGLIYGYFAYILARAWTQRRPLWIALALLTLLLYSGLIHGLHPHPRPPKNREGHHTRFRARRGRGAVSNAPGRYEALETVAEGDGWEVIEEPVQIRTEVREERARSLITYNRSPDLPFDRSINPYRGCEHGCIYCFARPSHAYLGLSPGLDFETRLVARPEAPQVLAQELAARRY
ncbi:MAG: rhomboid family intramembrane serine protease, partial [Verrucomicrobiales bacterium]